MKRSVKRIAHLSESDSMNLNYTSLQEMSEVEDISNKFYRTCVCALQSAKGLSNSGNFRVYACVLDRKTISVGGGNSLKTHPLGSNTRMNGLHAEMKVVSQCKGNLRGKTILVVRYRIRGPGLAAPCDLCAAMLKDEGVKKVYFTLSQSWEEFALAPKIGVVFL